MRAIMLFVAAAVSMVPPIAADARPTRYEYQGKTYRSLQACRAAKKRAANRGTVIGAAGAGVGAALLGGGLGGSLLAAGGGAIIGHEIGKGSKKC
jgi:hypothetical protein